jgi:hypothetical protein
LDRLGFSGVLKPPLFRQSYEKVRYHASKAVNGDTQGVWYTNSITHTKYEQGAWWQVDLGSKKNNNQIIIHNRTDCCANRLSNFQVSISNKADFSTALNNHLSAMLNHFSGDSIEAIAYILCSFIAI